MPLARQTRKSSSPKPGAKCTSPVPLSFVTYLPPARKRSGQLAPCIDWQCRRLLVCSGWRPCRYVWRTAVVCYD